MMERIQVFQLSIEELSTIIRKAVATEIKVANLTAPIPKDDSDKILTRDEVCRLLKVSTTTLFHWNNDKILVNHKVGRRVYYMKFDVMRKFNNLNNVA
jgi:hypothetical protein